MKENEKTLRLILEEIISQINEGDIESKNKLDARIRQIVEITTIPERLRHEAIFGKGSSPFSGPTETSEET